MLSRKKIMILGASILQLPAILKAKEMGLEVIAVDLNENSIGFNHADISLVISTIDIVKVMEAAKQYKIDGIMTLASDMPMKTVAAVASEMNLIGISNETAIKATNKVIMRENLKKHNVPVPLFFQVKNKEEYFSLIKNFSDKFIIKPADNSGSRGVSLVKNNNFIEVSAAFEYSYKYSTSGLLIIEEYMEGPEVSVETLSIGGNINVIAITDKLTTGPPNFVEMGHSQPSVLSNEIKKRIEKTTISAVKAIGIENGPAHTEIIVTKEGPKVVEIGARLGGDNITSHLVPLSTGINMVECCIRIALGMKIKLDSDISLGAAIRYFNTSNGRIKQIKWIKEAKNINGVYQITFTKNVGDFIESITSSSNRIGFVIAQASNPKDAIKVCEKAIEAIDIIFE